MSPAWPCSLQAEDLLGAKNGAIRARDQIPKASKVMCVVPHRLQACRLHFGQILREGRPHQQRLLPWCIHYASQLITRTRTNASGRTVWATHLGWTSVRKTIDAEECLRDGWTPRLVRWVDTNTGDEQSEQSRSRAVLQETRTKGSSGENGDLTSTFAVFPFSEALKAMTSMCESQKLFQNRSDEYWECTTYLVRIPLHPLRERCTSGNYQTILKNESGIANLLKVVYSNKHEACWDEFSGRTMQDAGKHSSSVQLLLVLE